MFCNLKTGLFFLKKGMRQSVPVLLLWAVVTPFFLFISFSALKRLSMGSFAEYCVGDFINSLNQGTLMNFLMFPLTASVMFIVSEQNGTANYILKLRTRSNLLRNQSIEVLFLSFLFSFVLVLISFLIAGFFASSLMNWSEQTSLFYENHGYTLKISFASVLVLTAYKTFIKLFFFLTVMTLVNLCLKKVFSFFTMFILSAARLFDFFQFEVSKLFNLAKEESYLLLL